jgi:Protein of unknown function (DUF2846)
MLKKLTILIFLLVLGQTYVNAQDATIYFYRKSKFKGALVDYKVYIDTTLVGKMNTGQVLVKNCAAGRRRIWAKTESEQGIFMNVEAGKTYFMECGVSLGVLVGVPTIRQMRPEIAVESIKIINPSLNFNQAHLAKFAPSETDFRSDTVMAINNLYQRKRKNGIARAGIFLGIAVGGTIGTGDPIGAILPVVISATGFIQASKYKNEKLEAVVKDYQNGNALPFKIKKKLKEKDFK